MCVTASLMTVGVMKINSSRLSFCLEVLPKRAPMSGNLDRKGTPRLFLLLLD